MFSVKLTSLLINQPPTAASSSVQFLAEFFGQSGEKFGRCAKKFSPSKIKLLELFALKTWTNSVNSRGVTVLLPGWVIWKFWNCPCKFFSLGNWTVSAPSAPNGKEGYKSSTYLNPITNSSIQLQCIQARSPHPADKTTSKPQAKCCMWIFYSSTSILDLFMNFIKISKKSGIGHQIFKELRSRKFFETGSGSECFWNYHSGSRFRIPINPNGQTRTLIQNGALSPTRTVLKQWKILYKKSSFFYVGTVKSCNFVILFFELACCPCLLRYSNFKENKVPLKYFFDS